MIRKIKKCFNRMAGVRRKAIPALAVSLLIAFLPAYPVSAAELVTARIDVIKTLVAAIITAAGAIVLLWGIFDFASAYQQHDSAQQTMALKKVIAGIIMALGSQIVALLV